MHVLTLFEAHTLAQGKPVNLEWSQIAVEEPSQDALLDGVGFDTTTALCSILHVLHILQNHIVVAQRTVCSYE